MHAKNEKTNSYFCQSHNTECKVREKNTQKQFNKFLDKRYEIDNKNVRKKQKAVVLLDRTDLSNLPPYDLNTHRHKQTKLS